MCQGLRAEIWQLSVAGCLFLPCVGSKTRTQVTNLTWQKPECIELFRSSGIHRVEGVNQSQVGAF